MINKEYCMSSYLAFRYIVDDNVDFFQGIEHRRYTAIPEADRFIVHDEDEIDSSIKQQLEKLNKEKTGILLSGGMDSACLASYLSGCDAYTFRFNGGKTQSDELKRAEYYAKRYELKLHYVDISWEAVSDCLDKLMINKGAPVHSIEPQVYLASEQAKKDGIETMIIGDAADYVFGGMDGLHAKDWKFSEFIDRYTFLRPEEVLCNPVNIYEVYEKYRQGEMIDFIGFMHEYTDIESYASYENAFNTAGLPYVDPYEILKMSEPLDLYRIRNGESKYLIRALFRKKYPEIPVPNKLPMPRPVDEYFKYWEGPRRAEFRNDIDLSKYTGNQKWQMYCLDRFLTLFS